MFSASCLIISTPSLLSAYIAILDRECVLQTGLHHLEELRVVAVVANVVEDVLVGDDVESAENDDNRDVLPDVRDGRADRLARLYVWCTSQQGRRAKVRGWHRPRLTCRSVRRIILTCSDEMVLPPFSTADRISARYEIGDGWALAKT